MMIDWFRGEVPFFHEPLPMGRVLSIEPDGSIEWEVAKSIVCRSSHETSIKIKSSTYSVGSAVGSQYAPGMATSLLIDGNLSKFLQGHNVFGSCDLNRILYLTFVKLFELHAPYFDDSSRDLALANIKRGNYLVKMLDINEFYDCGNDPSVEAWLHAAGQRARSRHGRSTVDKGTVYLGKHSKRWAIKFYNKLREILAKGKTHALPFHLQNLGLEEFVRGKLRAEFRIFSKELQKHGITFGHQVAEQVIAGLFNEYMGKIDMTAQATLIDEALLNLPRTVASSYEHWRRGVDLRQLLPRNTFYRHRSLLLEQGIDISMPCPDVQNNNVVPLLRIIEAQPVAVPRWAYERNLIAA